MQTNPFRANGWGAEKVYTAVQLPWLDTYKNPILNHSVLLRCIKIVTHCIFSLKRPAGKISISVLKQDIYEKNTVSKNMEQLLPLIVL